MSLTDIYQDRILEHARHPRGLTTVAPAGALHERGENVLCGDSVDLYVTKTALGDGLTLNFASAGCMLCKASASILVSSLNGYPAATGRVLAQKILKAFKDDASAAQDLSTPDFQALLAMRAYPVRTRCVTLAWETYLDLT